METLQLRRDEDSTNGFFEAVNNGVLYVLVYVEDIYIRVLSLLVSILNPYQHLYLY